MIDSYLAKKGLTYQDVWDHQGLILKEGSAFHSPQGSEWIQAQRSLLQYKINKYKAENISNAIFFPVFSAMGEYEGVQIRVMGGQKHDNFFEDGSRCSLFNISKAIEPILNQNCVYIVEGITDAIKCYKEGIRNVVSILGTNVSYQRFCHLLRFTNNFILVLDPDKAGASSTNKIIGEFNKDVNFYKITLTSDPDEYLASHSIQEFKSQIKSWSSELREKINKI